MLFTNCTSAFLQQRDASLDRRPHIARRVRRGVARCCRRRGLSGRHTGRCSAERGDHRSVLAALREVERGIAEFGFRRQVGAAFDEEPHFRNRVVL